MFDSIVIGGYFFTATATPNTILIRHQKELSTCF